MIFFNLIYNQGGPTIGPPFLYNKKKDLTGFENLAGLSRLLILVVPEYY